MKKYLLLTGLLALVGCSGGNGKAAKPYDQDYRANVEATAYGVVHLQYAGAVTVKTDSNGKLTDVTIEEVFLPHQWAVVGDSNSSDIGDQKVTFEYCQTNVATATSKTTLAKHIKIGKQLYTAVEPANYGAAKSSSSPCAVARVGQLYDVDLYQEAEFKGGEVVAVKDGAKLRLNQASEDQDWAKALYEAAEVNEGKVEKDIAAKGVSIVVVKDKKLTHLYGEKFGYAAAGVSLFKSKSGYWPSASATQAYNWKQNAELTAKVIKDYGFTTALFVTAKKTSTVKLTNGNDASTFWVKTLNGIEIDTGVTWSDYSAYVQVAYKAYALYLI